MRRVALLIWLALVVASGAWRLVAPPEGTPAPDQQAVEVVRRDDGARPLPGATPVRLALRVDGPAGAPVVLLVPDSPPRSADLRSLAQALTPACRVITPDLPGFGGASRRVPDYGDDTLAAYLADALHALGQREAVHVVGFGQGGAVALALARAQPSSVRSLSLLSAPAVAEFTLLGQPQLNAALYRGQVVLAQALLHGLPHFGALDRLPWNLAHARRLAQTDRPGLREALLTLQVPALIVHGAGDAVVPLAAAREHHRLLPQSELVTLAQGHRLGLGSADAGPLARELRAFVARVERGEATRREEASAARLAAARRPFDPAAVPAAGGLTLVALLLGLLVATYLSEDLACVAAGLLVAQGLVPVVPAILACLMGIFTGDLGLYLAGRHFGRPALHRPPLRWLVDPARLTRSEAWFRRRGVWAVLLSRFVPGTRAACYVSAGVLRMPLTRYAPVFLLAASVWTPLLVTVAWAVGEPALAWLSTWSRWGLLAGVGLALTLLLLVRLITRLATWRGRRLLYSSLQRVLRWEFWPPWLFYLPLLPYLVHLAVRFRGLTVFTAANPGMPAGGFVGESKLEILQRLGLDHPHALPVARVIDGDAQVRTAFVEAFRERHRLTYPLVLKPDVGERGRDVAIVRDAAAAQRYLAEHPDTTLVQAFAPGREFGVFYYRFPGEARGRVLAVTDKRPVAVVGDGRRTLEALILADDRAVLMAEHFLETHAARLAEVPAAGERVPLVEIGTHCLGCLFLDGGDLLTPALEAAVDRLSQGYAGFHFGRYDLRTPSVEDFRAGHNFRVVELNGVTSEATSIYDPSNSLFAAYRVLMRQWYLAYAIGAANRDRGAPVTPLAELLRLVRSRGHARGAERPPPP